MLVSPAFAQAGPGFQGTINFLLPIALIFAVFYFLLIRPQQKKARDHRNMVEAVRRGDHVVTQGGIFGKVTKVGEGKEGEAVRVTVEIAPNVRVEVLRATLADIVAKPQPADSGRKSRRKGKEQA